MSQHQTLDFLTNYDWPVEFRTMYSPAAGGYYLCFLLAVPADGTAGYAPGCILVNVIPAADSVLYLNQGTAAACNFDLITIA